MSPLLSPDATVIIAGPATCPRCKRVAMIWINNGTTRCSECAEKEKVKEIST